MVQVLHEVSIPVCFSMTIHWISKRTSSSGSVVVDSLFTVTPIVGVCNCSMICCTLLYVHSRFAIILMPWWGRGSWLLCLVCLADDPWLLCGSSSRCHGLVCSLWMWYFLINSHFLFLKEPRIDSHLWFSRGREWGPDPLDLPMQQLS